MVQAEGGLLVRIKSLPARYKPGPGLGLHSSHFDVDGEELGLSWENNFHSALLSGDCSMDDLVFSVVYLLFSFSSVFPVICLLFLFSCGDL